MEKEGLSTLKRPEAGNLLNQVQVQREAAGYLPPFPRRKGLYDPSAIQCSGDELVVYSMWVLVYSVGGVLSSKLEAPRDWRERTGEVGGSQIIERRQSRG